MGQRTRMGRAKTKGVPISRDAYRDRAWERQRKASMLAKTDAEVGNLPTDNAGGRARFAAKHAAQPWVKYERTEQGSGHTGPKTAPARGGRLGGSHWFSGAEAAVALAMLRRRLRG